MIMALMGLEAIPALAAGASAGTAAGTAATISTAQMVAMAASALGTVASIGSSLNQSKSQSDYYSYNAQVAEANAAAARTSAELDAERTREAGLRLLATQRAQYGASGVTLEGTPTDVILGTAEEIELDAQSILRKGLIQSQQYTSKAALDQISAEAASDTAGINATKSLLTGLGNTYKIATYRA